MEIKKLSDNELILSIKNDMCSASMLELIKRHSKLYYNCIHNFHKKYTDTNLLDLLEDIYIVFNQSVRSFNPDKDTKFSTWLAHMSRFHCLNSNKKNKIKTESFENEAIDLINSKNNRFYKSKTDSLEKQEQIFDILRQLNDKRVIDIYKMRYFDGGKKNKLKSWNEIAKELNLSNSAIINIHNRAKVFLFQKLKSKDIVDKI